MSRIRTVKPELFRHEGLFNVEINCKLPIRLAFISLFTCCDREGRFKWRPQSLKLDMLPYDDLDILNVLNALEKHDFIKKYEHHGERYGYIPSFLKHQYINNREMPSDIPSPMDLIILTTTRSKTLDLNVDAPLSKPVQIVFEHWKTVMQQPDAKLDSKREALINKALNLGYSSEQLCNAITGCSLTPYNMGDNKEGQRYNGLHVILRDADQIDRFIRHFKSPPQPLSEADKLTKSNNQAIERWLHKKMQEGGE